MTIITGTDTHNWMLSLLAGVVRAGDVSEKAVLLCGENYNVWANTDPEPFQLVDDDGNVVWTEDK